MSAYRTIADLSDAVTEYVEGDIHARHHLGPNIRASMEALRPFGNVKALTSRDGAMVVDDCGLLLVLRPGDFKRRN